MTSLREKIEELTRFSPGVTYMDADSDGAWIGYHDVLRIVAEHERPQHCAMCEIMINTERALNEGTLPVLALTPGGPMKGGDARDPKDRARARHSETSARNRTLHASPDGIAVAPPPVGQAGGAPWRRGKPDLNRRKAWRGPWEVSEGPPSEPRIVYWFSEDGRHYGTSAERQTTLCDDPNWDDTYLRPMGITWVCIDQLAAEETARDADGGEAETEGQPAWVQYLRRLDREGVAMGGMAARDRHLYPELAALANLRRVIISGKDEAVIPSGVLRHGYNEPNLARPNGLDLTKTWTCQKAQQLDQWRISCPGDVFFTFSSTILDAMTEYANSLINP